MQFQDRFNPIRTGLLELVVLRVVASHEVYAADILAELTDTPFATQEGTLYPLLSKLRRDELVEYAWQESEAGPPRKYYRLTAKGREYLTELKRYWNRLTHAIDAIGA